MSHKQRRRYDHKCLGALTRHHRKRAIKILTGLSRHLNKLKAKTLAGSINGLHGGRKGWRRWIPKNCNTLRLWNDFRQYLQFFRSEISEKHREASDVSPGPGQTRHVADADWIGMGREYDRDRACRLPSRLNHGRGYCKDDIDLAADKVCRELRQLLYSVRPTKFDCDVLALDVAEIS